MLWYKCFRKDLESIGYVFNPYDPCVANKMIEGKQHTVCFHVDDLKGSHDDHKVNTRFLKWLNKVYGKHGEVKATRGDIHDYLGMTLDYSEKGKVKIGMTDYIASMVDDFPIKYDPTEIASETIRGKQVDIVPAVEMRRIDLFSVIARDFTQ